MLILATFLQLLKIVVFFFFRLQVVSTRVGGVPEVLPPELLRLAEPNVPGDRKSCDIVM